MVTTRYSDQQGSKSRQKVMRLYKRWHRPITKRYIKPPLLHIESSLDRLGLLSPTHDQRSSNESDKYVPTSFDQQYSKFLKATHRTKIRKNEIPRSMVVEAFVEFSTISTLESVISVSLGVYTRVGVPRLQCLGQ